MSEDLNARVAVLEDWRAQHIVWMGKLEAKLDAIVTALSALHLCDSPNTCGALQKDMIELAQENKNAMRRIESLERWRTFMSGMVSMLAIIWAFVKIILPLIFDWASR